MKNLHLGNNGSRCSIRGLTAAVSGLLIALQLFVCGCGVGPPTINRDRFDYASAISDSWKSQMLLNLVKIRYADTPVFLEVASVINQYSLTGQVGTQFGMTSPPWSQAEQVNGTLIWYDRPTITYAPLTGEKFAKNLLSPIPPPVIMSMVQSGWPVDFVFRLTCDSVNGVRNRSGGQMNERAADPQFDEMLAAMRRIQRSDTVGVRVQRKSGQDAAVIFFGPASTTQPSQDMTFVRQTLKLSQEAREFQLVFGSVPKDDKEFALMTRSLLQVLIELAAGIDVPEQHIKDGQVFASPEVRKETRLIRIRSGHRKPDASFAAVQYKCSWFWIDDGDFESKRMLSLLMLFFSLMEPGTGASAPIITIPAG